VADNKFEFFRIFYLMIIGLLLRDGYHEFFIEIFWNIYVCFIFWYLDIVLMY